MFCWSSGNEVQYDPFMNGFRLCWQINLLNVSKSSILSHKLKSNFCRVIGKEENYNRREMIDCCAVFDMKKKAFDKLTFIQQIKYVKEGKYDDGCRRWHDEQSLS